MQVYTEWRYRMTNVPYSEAYRDVPHADETRFRDCQYRVKPLAEYQNHQAEYLKMQDQVFDSLQVKIL